ncbi:MAG: type II toxin-antitoxin system VapC family toxin [Planctomycetes bacterium]|nr:type II toxin-antitoxin system VapC family toxin [Planctomycetota bacterium]
MSEVFADSFYYIALLNPADQYHDIALAATRSLRDRIVTTWAVIIEVADALSAPPVRSHCHRFIERLIVDPTTTVVEPTVELYRRSLTLYRDRPDKDWSLTDCLSFEVMSQRGIATALTADRHFVQAGFRAILQSENE